MKYTEIAVLVLECSARNVHSQFHADAGAGGAARIRATMHQVVIEQHSGAGRRRQRLQRAIEIGFGEVRFVVAVAGIDTPKGILAQMRGGDVGEARGAFFQVYRNPDFQPHERAGLVAPAVEHRIEPIVGMDRSDIGAVAGPHQTPIDPRPAEIAIGRYGNGSVL